MDNQAFDPEFAEAVREGLSATPKRLSSRYFYDATGDRLFQEIMASETRICPRGSHGGDIQGVISFDGQWLAFARSVDALAIRRHEEGMSMQ